ncbi:MAG: type II toxin-antitoxin system VapC family toxin [Gammaproteobacteria bacterium]|nr:type II toxin-antitoxin system VapC family toxin [Gammaproteobacteria bacterium]MBU1732647.1 type II toxin-antitoxin system VapC family toxin [Gammaproteobacteria bacterium]MBU1893510.1 type II toxin-antitoxin system VapC family toxin [Gammaproteobacteria bacterium]
MKYLLDTCTVSDFVKGQPGVLARIKATPPQLIAISTVTRMEIEFGMHLNPDRARKLAPVMDAFLSSISILPFEDADAKAAGAIRAVLQKQGQPIGTYDVLIAGCALARGMVVVTSNLGEFERVGGLQVENWR